MSSSRRVAVFAARAVVNTRPCELDLSKRIVLIDGDELTRLMIQYGVGCRTEETLFIKKVDEEFFEE